MGILQTVEASQNGVAPKNRVDMLLDVLPEAEREELEAVLRDRRWQQAAITRAIRKEYENYTEAQQLKPTSVRDWRAKRGLV